VTGATADVRAFSAADFAVSYYYVSGSWVALDISVPVFT